MPVFPTSFPDLTICTGRNRQGSESKLVSLRIAAANLPERKWIPLQRTLDCIEDVSFENSTILGLYLWAVERHDRPR
jgi:hypothetical protein